MSTEYKPNEHYDIHTDGTLLNPERAYDDDTGTSANLDVASPDFGTGGWDDRTTGWRNLSANVIGKNWWIAVNTVFGGYIDEGEGRWSLKVNGVSVPAGNIAFYLTSEQENFGGLDSDDIAVVASCGLRNAGEEEENAQLEVKEISFYAEDLLAAPGSPDAVPLTAVSNRITWDAVGGASRYFLFWDTSPAVAYSDNYIDVGDVTQYDHEGLTEIPYYYKIAAASLVWGPGVLSSEVSATPEDVTAMPIFMHHLIHNC